MNKRALSPLIATVLLVVSALIIGTATMSWGKNYVDTIPEEKPESFGSSLVIDIKQLDNPLKDLQVKYITDRITLEEYLDEEQEVLNEMARLE